MKNTTVLLLCIYACTIFLTNSEKCRYTNPGLRYGLLTVICANNTNIIPVFSKPVGNIICLDCNIPTLNEKTVLANFRGLAFNLSNSHVKEIKHSAFKTFTNATKRFIFENNDIDYVAPKVFSNFSALEEIRLQNNKISFLESKTFAGTNLTILNLSQNRLKNVSSVFDGLKVVYLNLSSNKIKDIPVSTFDQTIFSKRKIWSRIEPDIDLSNNLIEKIIPNVFKSQNQENPIQALHLQRNFLTVVENNTFSELNALQTLSLEQNQISILYTNSFKGLNKLKVLNLKNNLIEKIPINAFSDLYTLETLDLSQNHITTLATYVFNGLISLSNLNISYNNLRVLDDLHLLPLEKLSTLDITDTKLHDFKIDDVLEHHVKLKVLILNDNFWSCKQLGHIYKLMAKQRRAWNFPTRHFNVPNLNGIACSSKELDSYTDLTFQQFLKIISQDHTFQELYDTRLLSNEGLSEIGDMIKDIHRITYMFAVVLVLVIISFIHSVFKYTFMYLHQHKIPKSNKFKIMYAQQKDDVQLLC